ncbi:MAG: helix-turn-helix transcriptional regulator [Catenulispora sp.]|nr:helix-turn-helix transcriptional regulator [Catenulispora sp.]
MSSATPPHPTVPGRPCSVAAALQLVGERWSLLAIRELFYGNHRFEQLTRNTGAPRDRLAARLRALEEAGVVERRRYSERPERFEYHLTEAGRDLAPVLWSLVKWGDKWAVDAKPVAFTHQAADHPEHEVDSVTVCRTCGEQVTSKEVAISVLAPGWARTGPVDL